LSEKNSDFPCYHLDTNYLINYLTPLDKATDECRQAQSIVNRLRNQEHQLRVSAFTVGEFVNVIVQKKDATKNQNMLCTFYDLVRQGDFIIRCVENSELSQISKMMDEIRAKDFVIHPADVIITSHSIVDQTCCGLLTFEGDLANSSGIKEVLETHFPKRKFMIVDDPYR